MRRRSVWLMIMASAVLLLGVPAAAMIPAGPLAIAEENAVGAGSVRDLRAMMAAPTMTAARGTMVAPATPATPTPTADRDVIIHVVQPGDTLGTIARRYGVNVWDLARYNGVTNPDRILYGQTLRIPRSSASGPEPTQGPCACEEIVIQRPDARAEITNPVTVSGLASSPFEQTVVVAILDGSGAQVGLARGKIAGPIGKQGQFKVDVSFATPANTQFGRIQVYTTSPRDGALEHLSSITVTLLGVGDQ